MVTILMCVGMLVIAASQCFHVFKNYRRLAVQEIILNSILNQLTVRIFSLRQEREEEEEKKPGANRLARTDEQKALASKQRIEWWAKKRASEAKAPEAPKP